MRSVSLNLARGLAIAGAAAIAVPNALAACEGVLIQALTGSGANAKVGFVCGTGCSTKYYMVSSATSWDKWITDSKSRNDTGCGTFEDSSHAEYEQVTGSNMSYKVAFDPLTCGTTSIVTGTGNSMVRQSSHHINHTSICQGTLGAGSCEYLEVDGVAKTTNQFGCGISAPDTTGYTLVSSSQVSDPCEGTKTVQVWKYQVDNSRSTIKHESSSSPGYRMEYTTQLAISRAKVCANNALNNQFPIPGFPTEIVASGRAVGALTIAADQSSASYTLSRWRLAVTGTSADEKYEITLVWQERINGRSRIFPEKRVTSGSDDMVWYYPSEKGENVLPKEVGSCSYDYSKELIGASIKLQDK